MPDGLDILKRYWVLVWENVVKKTGSSLTSNQQRAETHEKWFWRLLNLYGDSRRFYHNNNHVINCLLQLEKIMQNHRDSITHPGGPTEFEA